jgi:hypothetical protein
MYIVYNMYITRGLYGNGIDYRFTNADSKVG